MSMTFAAGVFLMKHHCYVNSRSDRVLMSLGFRTCAALGLRMVKHIVQEDVTWCFFMILYNILFTYFWISDQLFFNL